MINAVGRIGPARRISMVPRSFSLTTARDGSRMVMNIVMMASRPGTRNAVLRWEALKRILGREKKEATPERCAIRAWV
jgi:hypothetical protein